MPAGFRFCPPNLSLNPNVHWALLRAFGPPEATGPAIQNPSDMAKIARRLGITTRIFSHCSSGTLRRELGALYDESAHQMQVTVARGLALERCLRVVDSVAQASEVPYALVKGAALTRVGTTPVGLRGACDIDILLAGHHASCLHSAMKHKGFREKTPTHPHHHYPMLIDDAGGAVEIHTSLPHVRFEPSERDLTFQRLLDANRLVPAPALSGCAHVPVPEVLLAHAIGHGIAQHGFVPQSYPLLRLVADAIDLDIIGNGDRISRALSWVQPDVSEQEVYALRELAESLAAGNVESVWSDEGPAGCLLRHMVCGSLDERYCNGLKIYQAVHSLQTLGFAEFLREYGRATFSLPDEDVTRIYGVVAQGRESRYKHLRPLDVAARILRMIPDAAVIAQRQLLAFADQRTKPRKKRG